MKDRDWFLEQLDKVIVKCGSVSMLKTEKGAEALQRIYDQGRADQNEYVRKKLNAEFYFRRGPNCEAPFLAASEIESIVRAAGPEVWE